MPSDPANPADSPQDGPQEPPRRARPCPLCGKPPQKPYLPFCSRGCRDRDMLAWFGEQYRVPTNEPASSDAHEPRDDAANDSDR